MALFFTSDTHFGHDNIIKYCNRPYQNIVDMNDDLVARWNALVTSDDVVVHLGDVTLHTAHHENSWPWLTRLRGRVVLIPGNHDRPKLREALSRELGWVVLPSTGYIIDQVLFRHIPYITEVWPPGVKFQVHGHCHGGSSHELYPTNQFLDVGVDPNNMTPLHAKDVPHISPAVEQAFYELR